MTTFNTRTAISVWLRYGSDTWTEIFGGYIHNLTPVNSSLGEILTVSAWGYEQALLCTYADTSWGVESRRHPSISTARNIVADVIDNYVSKSLDGAASGHNISRSLADVHNTCSITYLNSNYLDTFSIINRVCDIVTAWCGRQSPVEPSIHWFTDPDGVIYLKEIDQDSSDSKWTRYWKGSLTTLIVNEDMLITDFRKSMDEYVNDVLFATAFRFPAEDYLCEGQTGLWGHDNNIDHADDTTNKVVGAKSIKWTPNDIGPSNFWYPSNKTAAWNFDYIGSEKTPSYLSFYVRLDDHVSLHNSRVEFYKDASNYWTTYSSIGTFYGDVNSAWVLVSLPIGKYHKHFIDSYEKEWSATAGSIDWTAVNYFNFYVPGNCSGKNLWLDDLHIAGQIVRRAYDSDLWSTYGDQQKLIRNDAAVSDVLTPSDDSGMAGRLAYSEFYRGTSLPTVGIIQTPLIVDILPGQQLHIHACQKSDGNYRVDGTYRVKEVKHKIQPAPFGFRTELNLTSDCYNSRVIGAPSIASLLQEHLGALNQSEAKDLKGSTLDNLITRLEKNY